MSLYDEKSQKNNETNANGELDFDKIRLLSQNPKVKSLLKQIMDKLARNKKYKKNSIEMLNELKNELIEVLNKPNNNKKNDNID